MSHEEVDSRQTRALEAGRLIVERSCWLFGGGQNDRLRCHVAQALGRVSVGQTGV